MVLNSIEEESIPDRLCAVEQWICWRAAERDGKVTKVPTKPYDTSGSPNARTDAPSHWRDFETALAYHREGRTQTDGIGFVFSEETDVVGVDLDGCRDAESGNLAAWAEDVVERLDSYTEVSPSGSGVHVLVEGQLPAGRNRRDGIEMYDTGRFFTVTGRHVAGTPREVHRRQDAINGVHLEYVQRDPKNGGVGTLSDSEVSPSPENDGAGAGGDTSDGSGSGRAGVSPVVTEKSGLRRKFGEEHPVIDDPAVEAALHNAAPSKIPIPVPRTLNELAGPGVSLTDEEVLERAFASKSGERIEALFRGDSSLFEGRESAYPSQSEADMALLFYLAFWTGKDLEQMERLFRESGLMRSKWDRRHYGNGATYGRVCLARTLLEVTDYYEPPAAERARSTAEQFWGGEGGEGSSSSPSHQQRPEETQERSGGSVVSGDGTQGDGGGRRSGAMRDRPSHSHDVNATVDAQRLASKVKQQQDRLAEQASYIADLELRLQWYREALGIEPPVPSGTQVQGDVPREEARDTGEGGVDDIFASVSDVEPPGNPPPAPLGDEGEPDMRIEADAFADRSEAESDDDPEGSDDRPRGWRLRFTEFFR